MNNLTDEMLDRVCLNLADACFMGGGANFTSVKRIFVDDQIATKFK